MEIQSNKWESKAEMTVQEICFALHSNETLITEDTENRLN